PYPVLVDTPGLVSLNLPFVNQADGFPGEEFLEAGEARIQPLVRIRMLVVLGLRPVQEVHDGVTEGAHNYPAGHPSSSERACRCSASFWKAAILFRSVAAKRVVPLCSFRSKVNR